MTCHQARIPAEFSHSIPQTIPQDNDELSNEITRLAGHINAANYRFLKLLAALVERGAWAEHGMKSPAQWLPVPGDRRQETSSNFREITHLH